jgi:hypothetical protein
MKIRRFVYNCEIHCFRPQIRKNRLNSFAQFAGPCRCIPRINRNIGLE